MVNCWRVLCRSEGVSVMLSDTGLSSGLFLACTVRTKSKGGLGVLSITYIFEAWAETEEMFPAREKSSHIATMSCPKISKLLGIGYVKNPSLFSQC